MLILGLDFETTGLSKTEDRITEMGAVLWDTEAKAPVRIFNSLITQDEGVTLRPEIVRLTGITDEMLKTHGDPLSYSLGYLTGLISKADAVIAHNAPFDKGFYEAEMQRLGYGIDEKVLWADSAVDVPYPEHIETRKLVFLAAEHGFVNPFAHRAVTDVLTMLRVCAYYDWGQIIESAKLPNVTLWAKTTFHEKDIAKAAGYRWNGDTKQWLKTVKLNQVNAEIEKLHAKGVVVAELT